MPQTGNPSASRVTAYGTDPQTWEPHSAWATMGGGGGGPSGF